MAWLLDILMRAPYAPAYEANHFDSGDKLLRELKKRSAEEGRTLQAVTNDLLRRALAAGPRQPYQLRLHGWKATELPGVDLLDREALFDLMDGCRKGEG